MSDSDAVRELGLYIENDSTLYRQTTSIIKNLDAKVKKGKYDGRLAPKLWRYLVDEGAKKYARDFGGDSARMFPGSVRNKLAEEMAREYEKEARTRGLTIDDDRHLCHACAMHEVADMSKHRH